MQVLLLFGMRLKKSKTDAKVADHKQREII
jgi:hypothetical protein